MLLHFLPHLQEAIRAAWGKVMVGSIVVDEPEKPSLPRAPSRVRTLVRIDRVYDDPGQVSPELLK